jgi:biopolymer transport protein ExbD
MSFLRKRHPGEQDFELNLASIIDCFTVLITYLLISASFISLGVLDVSVTSAAPSTETPPLTPPLDLNVLISATGVIQIKVTGPKTESRSIAGKEGQLDLASLMEYVKSLKTEWPALDTVTLAADDGVEYHEVVKTVESMRRQLASVVFGDRPL